MNNLKSTLIIFLCIFTVVPLIVVEYLRHRSYLKHRHKGFVPGTQHIAIWGSLISGFFIILTFLVGIFL